MKAKPVVLNWSGGKDSALALYELMKHDQVEVDSLLTTVNKDYRRVSMHGIREDLLIRQARNTGVPLEIVWLSAQSSNEEYSHQMEEKLNAFKIKGIKESVFGDIFLEDIRTYRENQLKSIGMKAFFPLWGCDTKVLAQKFIDLKFEAVITCVDTEQMPAEFLGAQYDEYLLENLPGAVDPCGENGEFHTLVYSGPVFDSPLKIKTGEKVLRDDRFYYCDVLAY
jgi:uncharacterized protein (TIGR00290 family)